MNLLGLSAFYHESACCLLRDGRLVAAASEERFSRKKHDPRLPVAAFRYCLEAGGLSVDEVDAVAYYESPRRKLARQLWSGRPASERGDFAWLDPRRAERAVREGLGFDGTFLTFDHHLAHAASAYFCSGFDQAAVLTADGVGTWSTTAYAVARENRIEPLETVRFPHSLGLLYSTITSYLGFAVHDGEHKVMGLAAYGEPRLLDQIFQLVGLGPDGQFLLNRRYFDFMRGRRMYSDALVELFGRPPRRPEEPIEDFHRDLARSLQLALEEILLEKLAWLHERTGLERLCMAGGVALNAAANGRIRREGPFAEVFIQPAAGDAGACLGAAALAHVGATGERPETPRLPDLGPSFSSAAIGRMLAAAGLAADDRRGREAEMLDEVAARLEAGQLVGFFTGRMELGPRALGHRSILSDPRREAARERLNRAVKRRESFRPFAPSVLAAHAAEHFELAGPSPFMLETCRVRSPIALPAVTHVDGTARPQTVDPERSPRFAALLEAFHRRTGCPILLNTSFNRAGEPIVCTPADAVACFAASGLDALVLEDFVLERAALAPELPDILASWQPAAEVADDADPGALDPLLYTFV